MSWNYLLWNLVPDKPQNTDIPFKRILKVTPNSDVTPICVYIGNGSIQELENTSHCQDVVNYLNKKGLHIYLIEPMCSYILGNKPNFTFYSELAHNDNLKLLRSQELDSILIYKNKNNLTNITVHTGDYRVENYYSNYYNTFKIICDDIFLKTCYDTGHEPIFLEPTFTKKFINLNWRYTKHRNFVAAYLSKISSNVSWYYKISNRALFNNLYFDLDNFKNNFPKQYENLINGLNFLSENIPLNVDLEISEFTELDENFSEMWPKNSIISYGASPNHNSLRLHLIPFYRDSFCDIITETRYAQPTGNFSEKVYQAVFFLKPFAISAPPYTLQYIREQGFITFQKFWDESYDFEEDHGNRLGKLFQTIDYINSLDISELKLIYKEMEPILTHNKKLLMSMIPEYYQNS